MQIIVMCTSAKLNGLPYCDNDSRISSSLMTIAVILFCSFLFVVSSSVTI